MLAVKNQNPILNQHIILKPRDKSEIVSIKGNFEMEHTISRNNAQYIFCTDCAILRNVKQNGYNWINKRVKSCLL